MRSRVYSVPGQTEGRKKAVLEWKSIDFSSKLSLVCGGNVNYYKRVHHPILTFPVGIGNTLAVFQIYNVPVYSLIVQSEEETEAFLEGARRGIALWDYPQEHLFVIKDEKVCPFVKFEIILPLLCCQLDPLTNKDCRAWRSMINLSINSRNCRKYRILLSARQRSNSCTELSKESVLENILAIFSSYLQRHNIADNFGI